jgi:hypothetical protein
VGQDIGTGGVVTLPHRVVASGLFYYSIGDRIGAGRDVRVKRAKDIAVDSTPFVFEYEVVVDLGQSAEEYPAWLESAFHASTAVPQRRGGHVSGDTGRSGR